MNSKLPLNKTEEDELAGKLKQAIPVLITPKAVRKTGKYKHKHFYNNKSVAFKKNCNLSFV